MVSGYWDAWLRNAGHGNNPMVTDWIPLSVTPVLPPRLCSHLVLKIFEYVTVSPTSVSPIPVVSCILLRHNLYAEKAIHPKHTAQ